MVRPLGSTRVKFAVLSVLMIMLLVAWLWIRGSVNRGATAASIVQPQKSPMVKPIVHFTARPDPVTASQTGQMSKPQQQQQQSAIVLQDRPAIREYESWAEWYESRADPLHQPAVAVSVKNALAGTVGHVPSLIIPGVMKCGTTFLRILLAQHPNLISAHRDLGNGVVRQNLEGHFWDDKYISLVASLQHQGDTEPLQHQAPAAAAQIDITVVEQYSAHLFDESQDSYDSQLAAHGGALRFDVTPRYLKVPKLPAILKPLLPHVRFVVVLRDPAERYRSHLQYIVCNRNNKRGIRRSGRRSGRRSVSAQSDPLFVPRGFHQGAGTMGTYLDTWRRDPNLVNYQVDHGWTDSPLERGLYVKPLQELLAAYDRSNLLVIRSEDLFAQPQQQAQSVVRFMGLKDFDFVPKKATQNVMNNMERCFDIDAYFTEDDRVKLRQFYSKENQGLSELLGMDFTWL